MSRHGFQGERSQIPRLRQTEAALHAQKTESLCIGGSARGLRNSDPAIVHPVAASRCRSGSIPGEAGHLESIPASNGSPPREAECSLRVPHWSSVLDLRQQTYLGRVRRTVFAHYPDLRHHHRPGKTCGFRQLSDSTKESKADCQVTGPQPLIVQPGHQGLNEFPSQAATVFRMRCERCRFVRCRLLTWPMPPEVPFAGRLHSAIEASATTSPRIWR